MDFLSLCPLVFAVYIFELYNERLYTCIVYYVAGHFVPETLYKKYILTFFCSMCLISWLLFHITDGNSHEKNLKLMWTSSLNIYFIWTGRSGWKFEIQYVHKNENKLDKCKIRITKRKQIIASLLGIFKHIEIWENKEVFTYNTKTK